MSSIHRFKPAFSCVSFRFDDRHAGPRPLARAAATALILTLAAPGALAQEQCTGPAGQTTSGTDAFACGTNASATSASATAVGSNADASGEFSVALGRFATASATDAVSVGASASATGADSTAVGALASATQTNATALGVNSSASAEEAVALGHDATVLANGGVALGALSRVDNAATFGLALGANAQANAAGSVALGAGSLALEADTVSVGSLTSRRRIVNMGAGLVDSTSTNAINGSQLFLVSQSVATHLGGGASVNADGTVSAPTYLVGGNVFNDVGTALSALDGRVTNLEFSGGADPHFVASDGPDATADGANATAAGANARATADNSVALGADSVADRANTVSVGSAGGERQVANVAPGSRDTDAVNLAQMQQQAGATLVEAHTYTDQRFEQAIAVPLQEIERLRQDTDDQFRQTNRRINRQGAMNAAMIHMASSAANIQTTNRVSVGAGWAEGEEALSVGYQRSLRRNVSLSLGAAFSGSEQSAGAGIGIGW